MSVEASLKPSLSAVAPASAVARAAMVPALAFAAVGAASIAGAWFFQLVLEVLPCELCLEQRYAYYVSIPLALLTAIMSRQSVPRPMLVGLFVLLALAAFGNAGLGVYHAGVEWGFWPGPTACTGSVNDLGQAGNLLERLSSAKVIRCDEVQWRFLGLSLAGYNVLISALMAVLALWGIGRVTAAR